MSGSVAWRLSAREIDAKMNANTTFQVTRVDIQRSAKRLIWLSAIAVVVAIAPYATAQSAPQNFVVHAVRKPVAEITFQNAKGVTTTLAEFTHKVVVLNLWATWCVPCRREMPALDRLQTALGGPNFAVAPLSIDRGGIDTVTRFYADVGIQNLPIYLDASGKSVRDLGAVGLPTSLILDRGGQEIARVVGPAEWDAPEVIEFLKPVLEQQTTSAQQTKRDVDRGSATQSAAAGPLARGLQWFKSLFLR
jgi:thiol-disulfide isomerase/thioredoxin